MNNEFKFASRKLCLSMKVTDTLKRWPIERILHYLLFGNHDYFSRVTWYFYHLLNIIVTLP